MMCRKHWEAVKSHKIDDIFPATAFSISMHVASAPSWHRSGFECVNYVHFHWLCFSCTVIILWHPQSEEMIFVGYQNNAKCIKYTLLYLHNVWWSVKHIRLFLKIWINLTNLTVIVSQSEGVYKHRNVDDIFILNCINMMKERRNWGLHNFFLYRLLLSTWQSNKKQLTRWDFFK